MSDVAARPLRPPALSSGDTIAVVSPSWCGPAEMPTPYRRGLAALRAHGFEVRVMAHAERRRGWVSGTPQERVADLHDAFADQQVRAVLCTIGGLHSARCSAARLRPDRRESQSLLRLPPTSPRCTWRSTGSPGSSPFMRPAVDPPVGRRRVDRSPTWSMHFAQSVGTTRACRLAARRADYEIHDTDFEAARTSPGSSLQRTPSRPREVLRARPREGMSRLGLSARGSQP